MVNSDDDIGPTTIVVQRLVASVEAVITTRIPTADIDG
jgi:hypothetical protein